MPPTMDHRSRGDVTSALRAVAWPDAVLRAHRAPDGQRTQAREQTRPDGAHQAWEIRDAAGDGAAVELWLYEEIGGWGVWAEDVAYALARTNASEITVRVNSPGGDVFDGIAIMNALIAHPARVTVMVDGLAASIASVITLAGDRVVMGHSAQMMIHNASTLSWGEAAELRKTADLLDQVSGVIAQAYADRTGTPVEEWAARMDAETWITAQDCVHLGLADEVAALPSRDPDDPAATGVDPDTTNRAARPLVAARPAARADADGPAGTPVAPETAPVDALIETDDAPDDAPAAADAVLVAQVMGWALAVDQHVDRLIAECAARLGVPNPDVDGDTPPPPLPPGTVGLGYALGVLDAIDATVDAGRCALACALGLPAPDDSDDDADPGDDADDDPGTEPEAPTDPAATALDRPPLTATWADLASALTAPDDPFGGLRGAWE